MVYQEMINNSTVIKTGLIPKANLGVMSSKNRKRSLIVFLFLTAYTILSKFVFKTNDKFDPMYIVLVVNLISLFILKLISASIFKLNHVRLYSAVFFVSRICKLIIFISVYIQSTQLFLGLFEQNLDKINVTPYENRTSFLGYDITYFSCLLDFEGKFIGALGQGISEMFNGKFTENALTNLFANYSFIDWRQFVYREASILLFVPVLLYFLSVNIKYICLLIKWLVIAIIPIYNIVYYFKWLFNADITFEAYEESADPKFIRKDIRLLNPEAAADVKSQTRAIRFLESIGILLIYGIIAFVVYSVFNTFVVNV